MAINPIASRFYQGRGDRPFLMGEIMRRLSIVTILALLSAFAFTPSMSFASTTATPVHKQDAHKKGKKHKGKKHAGKKHGHKKGKSHGKKK
jgi:hypothetical protein